MSAGALVKRASAVLDAVVKPPAGVTILIYHRVGGGSTSAVDLDADAFDDQLAHLAAEHDVITLDEAVARLRAADADDDRRAVVITFDDGTADFTDVAVPLLSKHGLPATLYVATRFVDEAEDFPWGAPPASWTALRDSLSTGLVTIGSHTHTHSLLDRLDPVEIADDLDRSIDLIGTHLGLDATHFAYPKAVPGSPAAEIEVRRRFASASLAANRVNRPGADVHRLTRTPIQRSDGFDWFTKKADGGLRLEGEVRALLGRTRYRGATT